MNKVCLKSYVLVFRLSVFGMMSQNASRCRSARPFTCAAVCPRDSYGIGGGGGHCKS
jgi:hypothetical protein